MKRINNRIMINQIKVGVALSYLSILLTYFVSLIYTPIMLRLLGQSEYGLYNLVSSVIAYLGVLNFGFGSAYMRYYSKYKVQEEKKKIEVLNGMILIIFIVIGAIAVFSGIVLALKSDMIFGNQLTNHEQYISKVLMIILVFNLALSFPSIIFNSYVTANEKFVFQKTLQLVKIIVNPFVIIPALYMGYGSIGMAIATTGLSITMEIVNALYAYRKLNMRFNFRGFDKNLMKEMTLFSSFIFINMVSSQISWNVDKLILGRMHGTISVAVYGLAAQINSYYLLIGTTISHLFIPRVHSLVSKTESKNELNLLFAKIGRIQFMILSLISIGFIFFGKVFIGMWAGNNYAMSYAIILILILPATLPLIQNIGIEIQRAKNLHSFSTWVYLIIAIINVIISIPLAQKYEGVGAALGTALALIIGNGFIMNWYYKKRVGLDIKYFWMQIIKIIPALIVPVTFGVIVTSLLDLTNLFNYLFAGVIFVILYLSSLWKFGMNQFEKELFIKPIKRLLGRKLR